MSDNESENEYFNTDWGEWKQRIKKKPQREKNYVKKCVAQLTLMAIGFHFIYKLYYITGMSKGMEKALKFVPKRIGTSITVGTLPDVSTRISRGIFAFNTLLTLHQNSDNSENVVEILSKGEYKYTDLQNIGFQNDILTRVMLFDRNIEIQLYENAGAIENNFTGISVILNWEDGKEETVKSVDADGNETERTVSVIDLSGEYAKMNDKTSSLIVRDRSLGRITLWERDPAEVGEKDRFITSIAITEPIEDEKLYTFADLQKFAFVNDKLTTIEVKGGYDVILYEKDNGDESGHSILIQADTYVNLKNRRMGDTFLGIGESGMWPNDSITSLKIVPKDRYVGFITFYDNDPVKIEQLSWSVGISRDLVGELINIPPFINDKITWVALDKGNRMELFEHANGRGIKLEYENTKNREGGAFYKNLKDNGGGMNDKVSSFRVF